MVIMVLSGTSIVLVSSPFHSCHFSPFPNCFYKFFETGDTTKVVTGSADSTLRLWDCETGSCISKLETTAPVRSCTFSYAGNLLIYTTDDVFSSIPEINVIDINSGEQMTGDAKVLALESIIDGVTSKTISSLWGAFDESIVTGHENGTLAKWDLRGGKAPTLNIRPHTAQINDMQFNDKQNMFITASKDNVAKVCLFFLGLLVFF